jgi:hypothetical protein
MISCGISETAENISARVQQEVGRGWIEACETGEESIGVLIILHDGLLFSQAIACNLVNKSIAENADIDQSTT